MKKLTVIIFTTFMLLAQVYAQPSKQAMDSIIRLSRMDYQNMQDQLKITSLRRGVNGSDPKADNAANYDEAKANPYTNLPDPLVLKNGKKVTTAKMWWNKRRPEIVEDFDREILGRIPKNTPKVNWEVKKIIQDTVGNIPVTTKSLIGHVDNSIYPAVNVDIILTLTTPSEAKNSVPVILELSWQIPDQIRVPKKIENKEISWQQQVLEKGWGYAAIIPTSIQADNGAGLRQGIIGLMNKGQYRKPEDWGGLRAWAWGASRALDYFETDKAVDAEQVGITGHSRYGKAALVGMAYDSRFAIGFISSSGEGGAKLHRRFYGEVLENLAGYLEYQWMAGNFLKYAGPLTPDDLPVDAHELIALCAPRPLFISNGDNGDSWADAMGTFLATSYASPVYELLGKKGLGTDVFPPVEKALISGDIAFRQHSGGHTPIPNWPTFIEFAGRYLNVKK